MESTPEPRTILVTPPRGGPWPPRGRRTPIKSAQAFRDEAMAEFACHMKQKVKVTRKGRSASPSVQTMPAMPVQTMAMGMVPMPMPAVPAIPAQAVVVGDDEEEVEETIIEKDTAMELDSIRHIWDAKIAERDNQWQSVIQEMQIRINVMSMHTHSQDSSFQCEIAGLKTQIVELQAKVGDLQQENGDLSMIRIKLEGEFDALKGNDAHRAKLYKELTDDYTRLKHDYDRMHEDKLELHKSVLEMKKDKCELVLKAEEERIRKTNIELATKTSALEADLDGAQVHIERLQGIISLLQVKLAERDDLQIQAAFSQEFVFAESTQPRVLVTEETTVTDTVLSRVSDLEIEARIAAQVMERTRETESKVEKKEKENIKLRAELDKVKLIEEIHRDQLDNLRKEHMRELEKVKASYQYLDNVIRVEPSTYDFRQRTRSGSPRGPSGSGILATVLPAGVSAAPGSLLRGSLDPNTPGADSSAGSRAGRR